MKEDIKVHLVIEKNALFIEENLSSLKKCYYKIGDDYELFAFRNLNDVIISTQIYGILYDRL